MSASMLRLQLMVRKLDGRIFLYLADDTTPLFYTAGGPADSPKWSVMHHKGSEKD